MVYKKLNGKVRQERQERTTICIFCSNQQIRNFFRTLCLFMLINYYQLQSKAKAATLTTIARQCNRTAKYGNNYWAFMGVSEFEFLVCVSLCQHYKFHCLIQPWLLISSAHQKMLSSKMTIHKSSQKMIVFFGFEERGCNLYFEKKSKKSLGHFVQNPFVIGHFVMKKRKRHLEWHNTHYRVQYGTCTIKHFRMVYVPF